MCKKSRGALMQLSEHVCILIIIAVSEIKATQDNLWGSVIFQYFNRRITIWAPKQNGKTVLLKVQYFFIWYPVENLLHLYKSCLLKWNGTLT